MFTFSSGELADIADGKFARSWLLTFTIEGTIYGFHEGVGELIIDGIPYVGAGSLLQVEAINAGVDLSASPVQVQLRALPNTPLTPDLLASIDSYNYKNAPARLALAYFSRETGAVAIVHSRWRGKVDTVRHDEQPGGNYGLIGTLEPVSIDHSRRGFRMRSDADQKLIDPNDRFFEHAATSPQEELPYGRKESQGATQPARRGGGSVSG